VVPVPPPMDLLHAAFCCRRLSQFVPAVSGPADHSALHLALVRRWSSNLDRLHALLPGHAAWRLCLRPSGLSEAGTPATGQAPSVTAGPVAANATHHPGRQLAPDGQRGPDTGHSAPATGQRGITLSAVSSTAPLLQRWFSYVEPYRSP